LEEIERLQSVEELGLAQQISNVGSYRIDLKTDVIISFSAQMAKIYGMNAEQISAMDDQYMEEVLHVEDRERVVAAYREAKLNKTFGIGGTLFDIEYRILRPDGEIRHIHERATASKVSKGEVTEIVGTMQDITKRKQTEAELKIFQEDLIRNERLATLGQLTATVSHELRNPLGAMRPSLYLLQKHLPTDDERLITAFERLDRNIDRCDHIIDQMLDFTRIQGIDRQTLELDAWLTEELNELNIPDGIDVKRELGLSNLKLSFDPARLRRALINVYDNACHAMLEDGDQACKIVDRQLLVKTRASDQRVEIVVSDTGPGIAEDVLPRIFEPLYSTRGFGVGLGLATVQQALRQHDGDVEVLTGEGRGTSMVLWLPLPDESGVAV
jgi:PAS domain S-box-containing protein